MKQPITLPVRPPIIVHHMGAFDPQFPPNSLEAIRASLEANAQFIEIDVTALADNDYLLVHDAKLESETSGAGPVARCMADEARGLTFKVKGISSPFQVPTLGQVVALFREYPNGARLQLDFKNMIPFGDDEPLHRLLNLIEPLGARVLVSSGADWQLRKLRALAPSLDLGFDPGFYMDLRPASEDGPDSYPRQRGAYGYVDDHPLAQRRLWPTADYLRDRCWTFMGLVPGASIMYISHHLLVKSLDDGFNWAEELHKGGIKLDAWTLDIDNPVAVANAERLLAAGVDQFTTNTPAALAEYLSKIQTAER